VIHFSIDTWAGEAATRYAGFGVELNALYVRALTHPDGITPALIGTFTDEVRQHLYKMLATEEDLITTQLNAIAENALTALQAQGVTTSSEDMRMRVLAHVSASQAYLASEIFTQALRDINFVVYTLNTAGMTVNTRRQLRGGKAREQAIALLLERPHLSFFFSNRAGHQIPVAHHMRLLWRQTMLSVHNETVLHALANTGRDRAAILINGDNGLEQTGEIALLPGHDLPTYLDVRNDLFHPNSRSFLGLIKGPFDV
jgi:hypothetical protein